MLLKFHRSDYSLAHLRSLAKTDNEGTTALGLVKAAETLGFETKAIKADMSIFDATDIPYPFIAHVLKDVGISLPLQILFLLIFTVVTVVFFIKMCVFVADMAWYNLTIPLAAMSMATESFDYSGTWWKKYIYYNASIISQVLCMSLSVWCFTNMAKYGFIAFIASIGFGFLVVKTPDAVKDFWASTGVTKSAGMGAMRMFQNYFRNH